MTAGQGDRQAPEAGRGAAGHTQHPGVGSVAHEAALLLEVLQEVAGHRHGGPDAGGAAPHGLPREDADGAEAGSGGGPAGRTPLDGPECRVCPICQGLHLVRQVRPEVVDHLADAAASLLAAVRQAVAGSDPAPTPGPVHRGRAAPVEHIDITD